MCVCVCVCMCACAKIWINERSHPVPAAYLHDTKLPFLAFNFECCEGWIVIKNQLFYSNSKFKSFRSHMGLIWERWKCHQFKLALFKIKFTPHRICFNTFEIFGLSVTFCVLEIRTRMYTTLFRIFENLFLLKSLRGNKFETVKLILLDFDRKRYFEYKCGFEFLVRRMSCSSSNVFKQIRLRG